ncbi:hypothetical protein ACO0FP_23130 [Klebsiella pneumoniae]
MAGFINIKVHQDILYQWLRYDAGRGIKLYRGLQVAQLKTVSPVPGLIDRANQVLSGIIVNHHITGRQLPDAIIRQPLTSENIKFRPIQGTKTHYLSDFNWLFNSFMPFSPLPFSRPGWLFLKAFTR